MVKLLICGGGNGAHVFAGLAASQPGVTSHVLTLFEDEAERWMTAMNESGFTVTYTHADGSTGTTNSRPALVTKDPAAAMEGVDIVVFVVPAFVHEQYLKTLKPYIKPGLVLVGLPGRAGFEFAVRGCWGDLAMDCTLLSYESLPWACRINEFGKSAQVLGTKDTLSGASLPGKTSPEDATAMLQTCLGPLPKLTTMGHICSINLMSTNGCLHPTIMYGRWKDWDGTPLAEAPLFYNGIDNDTAMLVTAMSDEVMATAAAIMMKRPNINLQVNHILQWFLRCYSDTISDKKNLYSCIQTNSAYKGLVHPTVVNAEGKHLPNFKYRYLAEDIPCGLMVMRGIASIVGVATPHMDGVIYWAQGRMGKVYLVDGQLTGPDMKETRAPQRYGLTTLDQVLGLA